MRCDHSLHGIILSDGLIEVKCRSNLCGRKPGVVVLHRFHPVTGELVETKKYKDTPIINGRTQDVRRKRRTAVRNP